MITIIIPAYNCHNTINRTLSSLESQTDRGFKVILVDDNSEIPVSKFLKQYSFDIKIIRKSNNEGCGMARQTGIDNVDTDYFTFLDSDDMFFPYTVSVMNNMIKCNPEYDIIHSFFIKEEFKDNHIVLTNVQDGFTWCHGKIYKKSFIDKFNIKNTPEVYYNEDGYFNSICTELGKLGVISIPLYLWTFNINSVTRNINSNFHKTRVSGYIKGIKKSIEFILKYKDLKDIKHIAHTIKLIENDLNTLTDSDLDYNVALSEYHKLKELIKYD